MNRSREAGRFWHGKSLVATRLSRTLSSSPETNMNKKIKQQLETLSGSPIPKEYEILVKHYPTELKSLKASAGMKPFDCELFGNANRILKVNAFVRSDGFDIFDDDGEPTTWPSRFLVIGEDGSGDYFAINLKRKKLAVFRWNHDSGQFENEASSMKKYIHQIFRLYAELAIDDWNYSIHSAG